MTAAQLATETAHATPGGAIAFLLIAAAIIYLGGLGHFGWASPPDIAADIHARITGHWADRTSSPQVSEPDTEKRPAAADMSAPDVRSEPLMPPRRLFEPAIGPLPMSHLLDSDAEDQGTQDHLAGETKMSWVRRQLDARLLTATEIDAVGAELFDVHPDTIRRYRRSLRAPQDGTGDRPTRGRP